MLLLKDSQLLLLLVSASCSGLGVLTRSMIRSPDAEKGVMMGYLPLRLKEPPRREPAGQGEGQGRREDPVMDKVKDEGLGGTKSRDEAPTDLTNEEQTTTLEVATHQKEHPVESIFESSQINHETQNEKPQIGLPPNRERTTKETRLENQPDEATKRTLDSQQIEMLITKTNQEENIQSSHHDREKYPELTEGIPIMEHLTKNQPEGVKSKHHGSRKVEIQEFATINSFPKEQKTQALSKEKTSVDFSEYKEVDDSNNLRRNEKRTQLREVSGLWAEERGLPDVWSLLNTAYLCFLTGPACFTNRFFPMVRSYLGMGEVPVGPTYLLPRAAITQVTSESGDTTRTEGKMVGGYLSLRHAKEAALALTGIVVALLPWLAGLAAVTYKALVTGLVSLAVTAAVTHQRSYFM